MATTAQKISETTPYTLCVDTWTRCGSDGLKTVWTVYRGLVPMSPNTTPRAPSSRAPRAVPCLIALPLVLSPTRQTIASGTPASAGQDRVPSIKAFGTYSAGAARAYNHPVADFASFFGPLTLVPPGVVDARQWHPGWEQP